MRKRGLGLRRRFAGVGRGSDGPAQRSKARAHCSAYATLYSKARAHCSAYATLCSKARALCSAYATLYSAYATLCSAERIPSSSAATLHPVHPLPDRRAGWTENRARMRCENVSAAAKTDSSTPGSVPRGSSRMSLRLQPGDEPEDGHRGQREEVTTHREVVPHEAHPEHDRDEAGHACGLGGPQVVVAGPEVGEDA